ncbi:MAG: CCA tRNA nucleotidyltransferase [Alphaproteobacteria bacterium]|nr:CCA tRNA nucleotidyltransferase [Alphaproteobacteria bacterium]
MAEFPSPSPSLESFLASLPMPNWLNNPQLQPLLQVLNQPMGTTRFVGGCVRDWLLQLPPGHDIDLATRLTPEQVIGLAESAGFVVIPSGIAHGTVTILIGKARLGGWRAEITTLRRDQETDGRHATVSWLDDWSEDANRRDFTMNGIYCTAQGELFDPLGGIDDLRAGLVRFIGKAEERIAEDHLRLLRYFRFLAWFGRVPPLSHELQACLTAKSLLLNLSSERLWAEFKKLLSAPEPCAALVIMLSKNILTEVFPELKLGAVAVLARLIEMEERLELPPSAQRRLLSLLPPACGELVANRLKFSRIDRCFMVDCDRIAAAFSELLLNPIPYLRRYGRERVQDACLIHLARADIHSTRLDPSLVQRLTETIREWQEPVFPISGQDILAMGVGEGKAVGITLKQVETWWEQQNCQPDQQACLAYLERILSMQKLDENSSEIDN